LSIDFLIAADIFDEHWQYAQVKPKRNRRSCTYFCEIIDKIWI